ncbi:MAG: hypothetical protein BWK78_01010, partial [Thiotrichaceae bacterium IS1]
ALSDIVKLKLSQLARRLQEQQKVSLVYQEAVIEQITQRCTEVETGARNIDHILNRTLLPQIASEVLVQMSQGSVSNTLEIGVGETGEFTFKFANSVENSEK